jgi:DNA-binding IclR family transcriptional regulator
MASKTSKLNASALTPVEGKDSNGRASTSAAGKAFAILRVMRRAPGPLTLTSIAQEVGMAPSSAHSVLNRLLIEEAVVQDEDKRYELGPATFYIGSAFARGTPVYRSIWTELVTAANELGVTAALAVPWEDHHLVLNAHRAGDSDVAVAFGGRVPIAASSWGKLYYGWSGDVLNHELVAYTDATVTDRETFLAEAKASRELGYAVDRGEFHDGVGGVAAALTSARGYEGLASFLSPMTTIDRLGIETIGVRLANMTARASLSLGDRDRVRLFGSE